MYFNKSLKELNSLLKEGTITPRLLADESLKIIKEKDAEINAVLGVYSDELIDSCILKAEALLKSSESTLLTGIPIIIKDNILVKGEHASGASKILENYVSPFDATVIKKLKEAGAILIGRANMDEFAMGGSNENSAYGPTKNPLDITKVPGGSSGGSAAVVAYGGVSVSLGSDTGGSIRQPASFCGLVGLKPTYGNVSRYGLMSMGSSLDQIGPFGNCIDDVEEVFNIIKGHDVLDATTFDDNEKIHNKEVKKIIGVPREFIEREGINKEVLNNFNESIKKLEKEGYTIKDIKIKNLEKSLSVYYIIMFAEVSSNLARYDGIRYGLSHPGKNSIDGYFNSRTSGFGDEVRRRILLGTYVLSSGYYDAYYNKAQILRAELKKEFKNIFKDVDVIAMPTTPMPAFNIGEKSHDPLSMYLADIFTVPINIVGVPAISIPSGKTENNLPLSIQLVADEWCENVLFTIGRDFERVY